MDRQSGGKAKPARRFSFSWADEVEREEEAQQQQEEEEEEENQPPPRRGGEAEEQTKANPFGAARPREVVLAEKGVDWRARDRELDNASRRGSAIRSRGRVHGSKRHAAAAPVPARRHEDLTPTPASRRKTNAPPVSYGSAWGGKRKCAGQDEPPRQVRPVADRARRVFGQLNIGEDENRGSLCTERIEASNAAVVDDDARDKTVQLAAGTKTGGSVVGQRRRRSGRKKMESNKAKKQQTLLTTSSCMVMD